MSRKRHKPEEIVSKLRQGDVLVSPGQTVADAIRAIGVTEVAAGRTAGWGDLLHPCRRPGSWSSAGDGMTIRSGRMRLWATNLQLRRWLGPPSPPDRLGRLRRLGAP